MKLLTLKPRRLNQGDSHSQDKYVKEDFATNISLMSKGSRAQQYNTHIKSKISKQKIKRLPSTDRDKDPTLARHNNLQDNQLPELKFDHDRLTIDRPSLSAH
jgi:hypothetical protein